MRLRRKAGLRSARRRGSTRMAGRHSTARTKRWLQRTRRSMRSRQAKPKAPSGGDALKAIFAASLLESKRKTDRKMQPHLPRLLTIRNVEAERPDRRADTGTDAV